MAIDLDRFRQTFFEEAAEHVLGMEAALLRLEDAPGDRDLLDTIFRAAHSIKGASGTFGFDDVARFTHRLENLLDQMRSGHIECSAERLDLLLRSADVLRGLLASAMGKAGRPAQESGVLAELDAAIEQQSPPSRAPAAAKELPPPAGPACFLVTCRPDRDILRQGFEPVLLLRDLRAIAETCEVRIDTSGLPALADFDPESCYLSWSLRLRSDCDAAQIREALAHAEDICQFAIVPAAASLPQCPEEPAFHDLPPLTSLDTVVTHAERLIRRAADFACAHVELLRGIRQFADELHRGR